MTQDNRALRSVRDHRDIIGALEARDADRAERLVREHTMGLAAHVERFLNLSHEMGEAGERGSAIAPTSSAGGRGALNEREQRNVRHA